MKQEKTIAKFRGIAAIALAASLLMSCGGGKEENKADANLAVMEWSGFDKPRYYPEYLAKYTEGPDFTIFANTVDAMQRLRLGYEADVMHLCTGQMKEARDAGLIKPLDTTRIPRWNDVTSELLELDGVNIDGDYMLVPWEWGYSTIGYNPEIIDIENPTFDIFIDPRFKGKTALPSDVGVNILIAAIIGKWEDPDDPTEQEMAGAPEIFTKMLENARFIWSDSTQLEQAWAAGDVGISYIYGSASRRMPKQGMPVVVVEPLMTWMCGLSLGANGQTTEDKAYDYINAMLDTASGVELFHEYGYGHGNSKSADHIDPELTKGTGIRDPKGTFAKGMFNVALPPAKLSRLLQMWFEAQAGLGS